MSEDHVVPVFSSKTTSLYTNLTYIMPPAVSNIGNHDVVICDMCESIVCDWRPASFVDDMVAHHHCAFAKLKQCTCFVCINFLTFLEYVDRLKTMLLSGQTLDQVQDYVQGIEAGVNGIYASALKRHLFRDSSVPDSNSVPSICIVERTLLSDVMHFIDLNAHKRARNQLTYDRITLHNIQECYINLNVDELELIIA